MPNTSTASEICLPVNSYLGKSLSAEQLATLQGKAHSVELARGDYLIRQHCQAKQVYSIESGNLLVERIGLSGKRQVLSFLFPGDFLGFTHNDHFEFSVIAMSPSRVWSYSRRDLMNLAETIPGIKKNLDTIHNQVLAGALDQVFALGQKKAHERICFLFKMLLKRQPGATPDNLNLPMSRQDIADYLGLTIETVSRAFAKLKEMEIIEVDHIHHVNIIDPEQMEELASAE